MLIGLVGKPNVGKSTFFKAVTLSNILIANYPFATIKANHGVGYVRIDCIDKELNTQCNPREGTCINHQRFVPIDLIDVAGLVPGASEGKGLGNKFLNDLSEADAFIHILDISGETNVEGKQTQNYDPSGDIKFLEEELDLWYSGILKKVWKIFARRIIGEDVDFSEAVAKQFSGLKVNKEHVKTVVRKGDFDTKKAAQWDDKEIFRFAGMLRKISKPMMIAANKIDRPNSKSNLEKIKKEFDYIIVPCSAESELALREADKKKVIEYIPGDNNFKILKELNEKQAQGLEFIKNNVIQHYSISSSISSSSKAFVKRSTECATPARLNSSASVSNTTPKSFCLFLSSAIRLSTSSGSLPRSIRLCDLGLNPARTSMISATISCCGCKCLKGSAIHCTLRASSSAIPVGISSAPEMMAVSKNLSKTGWQN